MSEVKATKEQWLAVLGGLLGAFMAILDISITNSSLQDIQGGLNASLDEGAWISTSYLVAEIIVIPLSGWLSQVFSIRKYLVWNSIIFLFASIACGFAWNLDSMIFFRFIQGFSGGVLIPMSVTLIMTLLPKSQQPLGLSLFGISATFAPCIGPTVGGWLTINSSWHYVFFINIVPGLFLIYLIAKYVKPAPLQLNLIKNADWKGIGLMAIALATFTIVLEEGTRKDWFGSNFIITLTIISVITGVLFLYQELTVEKPFINLRLLAKRNFAFANMSTMIFGFGLYSSIFLIPLFLASIQRLNALQIGEVIMWSGLPQLLILPFIPKLVAKFDNRFLASIGFTLFGLSALMNSQLTRDWAFDQFFWSQIVRAVGQTFIITPMTALAYVGIQPKDIGSASGLFNMNRNLGGSIGIGLMGTVLSIRYHLHFTRLSEATSRYSNVVQEQIAYRAHYFADKSIHGGNGTKQAVASIYQSMNKEAMVMSYSDCFLIIGILFIFGALLILCTEKPQGKIEAPAH
jgi:DHA2 family multidrug resistance protein